uniref:Uncharacterized protein n=1 Tax=Leersia perrieri TaxID=77586 RepID=A0A0D9X4V1_9ORYZ
MATVLTRLHLSTIAGKRQLLHALRRSPAHQSAVLGGKNAISLLFSSPLRLKYNAAAGVSLDDNIAAKHHVIGALQTKAVADGDVDNEKMATSPARGGSKAGLLLGCGEQPPLQGGGPHYNKSTK